MVSLNSEKGSISSEIEVIIGDVNGARLSDKSPHKKNSRTKVDNENFTSSDKNYCYNVKDAYSLRQLKRRALALLDAHHSAVEARNNDGYVREASAGRDAVDAAAYEPPPRRARRRVRRRARQRTSGPEATAESEKEKFQESEKCPDPEKNVNPEKYQESDNCPDPEKDLDPEKYQESEKCPDPEKYSESEKDLESEKDMALGLEPRSEVLPESEPYSSLNAGSQCESHSTGASSPPRARLADVTRNDAARARPPRLVRALPD